MKINDNGELLIEGQTEARLTAHYLRDLDPDVTINLFEPPLPARKMGYLAFVGSRIEDFFGTSYTTTHRIKNPESSTNTFLLIGYSALPAIPFFKPPRLGRKAFIAKRLASITKQNSEIPQ